MSRVHTVGTCLLLLGGLVHVALAAVFFDTFTMRVMWYVGQGLMAVFVAFLNLVASRMVRLGTTDLVVRHLTNLANVITLVFVVVYLQVDRDPPGFVMLALIVVVTVGAWRGQREPS